MKINMIKFTNKITVSFYLENDLIYRYYCENALRLPNICAFVPVVTKELYSDFCNNVHDINKKICEYDDLIFDKIICEYDGMKWEIPAEKIGYFDKCKGYNKYEKLTIRPYSLSLI